MYFRNTALTVALGLTIALPVLAGDDHAKGYREHGAHVHGAGDLNVAVDGSALLVELHGPAANLVGFEHPPRNAAEEQVVADVRDKLADPALTFLPNAEAECTLTESEVFMELAGDDAGMLTITITITITITTRPARYIRMPALPTASTAPRPNSSTPWLWRCLRRFRAPSTCACN